MANDGIRMSEPITQPAKDVPVVREADVVVAGAGVAGVFAALGAAGQGASVLLIDRFGDLGGNMGGPGMIMFGGTTTPPDEDLSQADHLRFLPSIAREFSRRALALLGDEQKPYPVIAHAFSRVAFEMTSEAGVELMLSAYASDPVMEGNDVSGLFVETKSGRVAVSARVVVDATGDASIAERAGAPVRHRQAVEDMDYPSVGAPYRDPDYRYWNDGAIMYIATGIDMATYDEWRWRVKESEWGPGDREWFDAHFEEEWSHGQKALVPKLRAFDERGEGILKREIRPGLFSEFPIVHWAQIAPGVMTGVCNVKGEFDTGDWKDISLAEQHARTHAFDGMRFLKENIPGFECAEIVAMAAFLGARGGPNILGRHLLTVKEQFEGARHADTMFVSAKQLHIGGREPGYDVPYGITVPREIDGLLVTARGASSMRRGHDPNFRGRRQMMCFGQATGIAAALACKDDVKPRDLDVKTLQKALLAAGFDLGDEKRLEELGLR